MVIIAILLGFLPGFAWLFFYMQEDPHSEPKRMVLKAFLFGMAGAVLAFALEKLFSNFVPLQSDAILLTFASMLGLATIEELTKFFSAKFAVKNNPAFRTPVDAMIYVLVASLGFATLENIGAVLSPILKYPFGLPASQALASSIFEIVSFRFVGATLLHALTGAVIGYNWAMAIREFKRWGLIIRGIVLAVVLHTFFNYLILNYESYIQPIAFLMIVGFFVLADFEKLKDKQI